MGPLLAQLRAYAGAATILALLGGPKGLFVLLVVVLLIIYGLSVGKTRALMSLLAIYVAYMLAALFPFSGWLSSKLPQRYAPYAALGLFVVFYGIVFSLISGSLRRTRISLGEISFLQVAVISLVQIGLLTSIVASLVPVERAAGILGPLVAYFSGGWALWGWAAASLLILPFMRGHTRVE